MNFPSVNDNSPARPRLVGGGRALFLGLGCALGLSLPLFAQVSPPVLVNEHIDIKLVYDPANSTHPLNVVIQDSSSGRVYTPSEVILQVPEAAKLFLPPGTPFGQEGDPIWILPQSQDPELLYIGLSAEGIPSGIFNGSLTLRLTGIAGPGNFFAWQASQVGGLQVRINTADGLGPADETALAVGSHEHLNWGFSTNGLYRLTFQAQGTRGQETLHSEPITFTFHVEPMPPPQETPFQLWQRQHFLENDPEPVKGLSADPDLDSIPNIVEYAFGLDPKVASRAGLPRLEILSENGQVFPVLHYQASKSATDAGFSILKSSSAAGPYTFVQAELMRTEDAGNIEHRTLKLSSTLEPAAFFQLGVTLAVP